MPSTLHILPFSLQNPYAFSLTNPDSPLRTLIRLLTTPNIPISSVNLALFTGKTVLITGATSGCGFECAKALARVGCKLVLTARSKEKAMVLKREIEEAEGVDGMTSVDVLTLDMGDYGSVRAFGEGMKKVYGFLDAVVLNAGVYCAEFGRCKTGMEETTQVNFISTAALSLLLLPLLQNAPSKDNSPSRLLFISSEAHGWSSPRQDNLTSLLDALNDPTAYKPWMRYHISKLLLVLWTKELSSRLGPKKVLVSSASSNFTRTGMFRGFSHKFVAGLIEKSVCRTAEQGAAQNLEALVRMGGEGGHGGFWSDGGFRRTTAAAKTSNAVGLRESMWDGLMKVLPEDITEHAKEKFVRVTGSKAEESSLV
ncbi:uncharacterized protein BDV14DRAFT_189946 [Aspergillus stella-maris]|uniref:uncharacterized protein n=1 Tax=Aspergillus stella-maris TaxID=1810926 RepID=UPI003CCD6C2F